MRSVNSHTLQKLFDLGKSKDNRFFKKVKIVTRGECRTTGLSISKRSHFKESFNAGGQVFVTASINRRNGVTSLRRLCYSNSLRPGEWGKRAFCSSLANTPSRDVHVCMRLEFKYSRLFIERIFPSRNSSKLLASLCAGVMNYYHHALGSFLTKCVCGSEESESRCTETLPIDIFPSAAKITEARAKLQGAASR